MRLFMQRLSAIGTAQARDFIDIARQVVEALGTKEIGIRSAPARAPGGIQVKVQIRM
ncbi:MAG TPA: hypothetical protein PLN21_04715 [Gemmatales bacterium]|nr:hypothetical protein [Gemmatales bacterium]